MKWIIGDPITSFTDPCGCVWKEGRRIHVCPEHRHKHGITPDRSHPRFRC